jgi:hypothetical protein
MIENDLEVEVMRARIAYFQDLLSDMKVAAPAELFPSMASGYRSEIEKMQSEVLHYRTLPPKEREDAKTPRVAQTTSTTLRLCALAIEALASNRCFPQDGQ